MKPTFNKTKIVATVGPASSQKETLLDLIVAGVDVFRLNFSHSTHEVYKEVIKNVKAINAKYGESISILQDLQGPKIRIGKVVNDEVYIEKGKNIIITVDASFGEGDATKVASDYPALVSDIKEGEYIFIDDGKLKLQVEEIREDEFTAKVIDGGFLKSRKGINLPNTQLSAPALTQKDLKDLDFGIKQKVDWIAISFVRSPLDVIELKNRIKNSHTKVVAKIERQEAIDNIEEIIKVSDAIMVARGDLGVEINMEEVPRQQKRIIKLCNMYSKPVIVATHMMESMISNSRPTRAEVNDVANAVMDGTDAVMLSAETSTGKHPIGVIRLMVNIISSAEKDLEIYNHYYKYKHQEDDYNNKMLIQSACRLSRNIKAKAIIGLTDSGFTAFRVACHRPDSRIFIFTSNKKMVNTLNLIWGVKCFFIPQKESVEELTIDIEKFLKEQKLLKSGDNYVTITSSPLKSGKANLLKMKKVT